MTPTLSIQIYAEPFVSAGNYSEFQGAGRRRAPVIRGALRAVSRIPAIPTSTTGRSGRPTCSAGSTSRARRCSSCGSRGGKGTSTSGTFDFARDFGGVFDAPAKNVFLIKWAYWLNY